jgi:hypothetical protein
VCGWYSGQGFEQVPFFAPFCVIETDGTLAGGPFTGGITACRFGLNEGHAATTVEGTIRDSTLDLTVFGPDPFDGEVRAIEHHDLIKTF